MEVLNNLNFTDMVDVTKLLTIIGILAFIVSCITECLKQWKWLNERLPSGILAIIVSLIICPVTMLGMLAYYGQPITWYMVFASFIAAFVVALVSMNGWEHVTELAGKMVRK